MSGVAAVFWVLGALTILACLYFAFVFINFVGRNARSYVNHHPYGAFALFAVPGGLASYISAWWGATIPIAALIGAVIGAATFLLVSMELG